MNRYRALLVLCWAICSAAHFPAQGALIGFQFTASTSSNPTSANFWGLPQASRNPITGYFVYDTNTAVDPATATANFGRYFQHYPSGFVASFGGLTVRADDYVVDISNNFGSFSRDIITIRHASNISGLGSQLIVAGVPRAADNFAVNFTSANNGTVLSDGSLPNDITFSSFPNRLSFLSDTPTGIIDVAFTITSLTRFEIPVAEAPEPTAIVLLSVGLFALACCERRRR